MNSTSDIENAIKLLTSQYSIIDFGGEVRYLKNSNISDLLTGDINPITTRLNLYRKMDVELLQQRELKDSKLSLEQGHLRNIVDAWRLSPNTKCFQGTDFDPNNTDPHVLNLWRGPIKGQEGDWKLIHWFLFEIICNRDDGKYEYLLNFLAHAIQKPEEKPGVMLFFHGEQGTGKGTLLELIGRIWRYTTLFVQDVKEVVGDFNGGVERNYFVLMDEALFAGDGKSANALKSMVTEPLMRINEKNQPRRTISSVHRFVAATNSEVVAKVDRDDRRFFICEVSNHRQQDPQYFGRLKKAFCDGVTLPAFVHALETRDLTDFEVRQRPKTAEHGKNVLAGLRGFEAFIYDCLQQGQLGYGDLAPVFREVETHITNQELVTAYSQFRSVAGARYEDMKITGMKQYLKKVFGEHVDAKVYSSPNAKQPCRGVKFPPLGVMRTKILAYHKIDQTHHEWDEIDSVDSTSERVNGKSVISGKGAGGDSLSHLPFNHVPWSD